MNIFIDESGSFVNSPRLESWNVVAALTAAESGRKFISAAVARLRRAVGVAPNEEVKLNSLDEATYLLFLQDLTRQDVVLFAVATDAGLNTVERVTRHQAMQVASIKEGIPRMRYEGGRLGVQLLANQMESLSPQLYVQLVCQVSLLHDVIDRSINYFAQRRPVTLRAFRWRVDQKNTTRTTFEDAFEKIAPALLQTRSILEPMVRVLGFDYSHMKEYDFEDGKAPDYLQVEYGLPAMDGFDVQKVIRGDIEFVDSRSLDGVQAVDLLASGLRRVLRGKFADNDRVANALGQLMLQNRLGEHPIQLMSFSEEEHRVASQVSKAVRLMSRVSRQMLL